MNSPPGYERRWSIESAISAQFQNHISAVELTEQCFACIDDFEPDLHAWVNLQPETALRAAEHADAVRSRGRQIGPLHGIPIGVKDIFDVNGIESRLGLSKAAECPTASSDAAVVQALRDAGAVILGKTVTTQFACFDPPPTLNPWSSDATPGGSSSGSAVAVATGMCLAALGSQTGGSIHRPAAYCGIAGLKPTFGRLSRSGVFPVAPSLDHMGPMCVGSRDLELMLRALISAIEPREAYRAYDQELCLDEPIEDRSPNRKRPLKIGLLTGFFEENADEESFGLLRNTASVWNSQSICSVQIPTALQLDFEEILREHRIIMVREMADVHARLRKWEPLWLPGTRAMIAEGESISNSRLEKARRSQVQMRRIIDQLWSTDLSQFDALATLAAPGPPPTTETTGPPIFNAPWSFLGLPTVSFGLGETASKLPCAIQLIGRRGADFDLLLTAQQCEECLI